MWNGRGVLYVSCDGLNVGSVCWPGYSFGDRFLACRTGGFRVSRRSRFTASRTRESKTHGKLGFSEVDAVRLALDAFDHADLALDAVVSLDEFDPVPGCKVPVRDAVLDLDKLWLRSKVGRDRHPHLASAGRRRAQVLEVALEGAGQVPPERHGEVARVARHRWFVQKFEGGLVERRVGERVSLQERPSLPCTLATHCSPPRSVSSLGQAMQ